MDKNDVQILIDKINSVKNRGLRVGLVQGSWDLFHIGHLKYLLAARSLCDFLVVGMDSDAKIRERKGSTRPVIPQAEREEFLSLLNIADEVVIKDITDEKWELIKIVLPEVLISTEGNYSDSDIIELKKYCGEVVVLPRQADTSTSDKIRKIILHDRHLNNIPREVCLLMNALSQSTDSVCPVAAMCRHNGDWVIGVNKIDETLPEAVIKKRSELFYDTIVHAEIDMLKQLPYPYDFTLKPVYTTLFPCDRCMKVLADAGVHTIYYLNDHPEQNWSKKSHLLAERHGIRTIRFPWKEE